MKSAKKRGSRSKRRCNTRKRSKGGMLRAARATGRRIANKVLGETWPDRFSKGKDMIDAGLKGAAAAKKGAPRTPSSASSKSFDEYDSPRLRIDPSMHMMDFNNDIYYTTPKKSSENEVPILASRTRPEETLETRGTRLASFVAPTSHHPVPIVKTLFPE